MASLVDKGETGFIPVNNAIVLKEHKEREEAESRELADKIADIQTHARATADAVAKVQLAVERSERQLGGEGSAIGSVLERLDALRDLVLAGPREAREPSLDESVQGESSLLS